MNSFAQLPWIKRAQFSRFIRTVESDEREEGRGCHKGKFSLIPQNFHWKLWQLILPRSLTCQTSNATAYWIRTIIPYEIMETPVCGRQLVPPEFRITFPIILLFRNRIFSNYQGSQRLMEVCVMANSWQINFSSFPRSLVKNNWFIARVESLIAISKNSDSNLKSVITVQPQRRCNRTETNQPSRDVLYNYNTSNTNTNNTTDTKVFY